MWCVVVMVDEWFSSVEDPHPCFTDFHLVPPSTPAASTDPAHFSLSSPAYFPESRRHRHDFLQMIMFGATAVVESRTQAIVGLSDLAQYSTFSLPRPSLMLATRNPIYGDTVWR